FQLPLMTLLLYQLCNTCFYLILSPWSTRLWGGVNPNFVSCLLIFALCLGPDQVNYLIFMDIHPKK
ncbi:MAG: hypothetical protein L6406_04980, partial [Desulfobacterales bacterium]|nr:hypothetical protein [Desulfobacterales bacterium]